MIPMRGRHHHQNMQMETARLVPDFQGTGRGTSPEELVGTPPRTGGWKQKSHKTERNRRYLEVENTSLRGSDCTKHSKNQSIDTRINQAFMWLGYSCGWEIPG